MKTADKLQEEYIKGLFYSLKEKLQDRFGESLDRKLIEESISELFYDEGIKADIWYDESANEIAIH